MSDEPKTMTDVRVRECRHFNGIQHGTCLAGINYADVRDERVRPFRFPCVASGADMMTCDKREPWTREEAEQQEKTFEERSSRILLCIGVIRNTHGRQRNVQGEMPCPNSCGGTVHYSIASNGHSRGICSTEGCASWQQ